MTVEPRRVLFSRPNLLDSDVSRVVEVLRSGWLTTGPFADHLERALASVLGGVGVCAVSSCTAALHLALRAWGIGPGDEVISSTWTFCSAVNAIVQMGATPVLVDVDADTLNMSLSRTIDAVTSHTRAVIVTHFAGHPVDVAALRSALPSHIPILEDAAHALGASIDGAACGTLGNAAALSFYATKNVTAGEGGALVTQDTEMLKKARRLAQHGLSENAWGRYAPGGAWRYDMQEPGYKYNLSDIHAALAVGQVERLRSITEHRGALASKYVISLAGVEELELPATRRGAVNAWHLFVVRNRSTLTRDDICDRLRVLGIDTSVHFIPVHKLSYYRGQFSPASFPVANAEFENVISLPLSGALMETDVYYVAARLKQLFRGE